MVTLIQPSLWMKGSAANLNIHLHCLVPVEVCRCDTEGEFVFVEVPAPTDESLQTVLHKIVTRMLKLCSSTSTPRRVSWARPTWPTSTVSACTQSCVVVTTTARRSSTCAATVKCSNSVSNK